MSAPPSKVKVGDRFAHKILGEMVTVVAVNPQLRFDIVVEDARGERRNTHVWNLSADRTEPNIH